MSGTSLFSREAWERNAAIYEAIRAMPFNAQLASGSLSESRFKHYITQDAHYLVGFGRALALAAAKARMRIGSCSLPKRRRARLSSSAAARLVLQAIRHPVVSDFALRHNGQAALGHPRKDRVCFP